MNRFVINLLAVATIVVGGWLVLGPAPASAGDDDQACCENYKGKCCGDSCGFDPDSGYCHANTEA